MRSFLFVVLMVAFAGASCAQSASAVIVFEERVHNMGTIKEKDGKVSHTFVFQNKGKAPVAINDIYSGCGCIGKIISTANVQPGAKGKVTVTFDPGYKSGFFSKEIVVYSNNNKDYNRVWLEGNIIPEEHSLEDYYPYNFGNGLYLRLKVMAFGYMKPGETKQMELHYANGTDKEMEVNFLVDGKKDGLFFTNPGKIKPKAKGSIFVSYTMPSSGNKEILFRLYPYVNNKKLAQTLDIKILGE